jgi:spore cortex protein
LRKYQKFGWVPILVLGLVGCGNGDQTAKDVRTDEPLTIGYYSNENHENKGGNAVLLDGADNDGPVTEIMDHSLGTERNTNQRFLRVRNENNNQVNDVIPNLPNPTANGYDVNLNSRDPLIGGNDQNYHGHLNNSNHATRQSYYNGNNGNMNERITELVENVENVKEAKTVIHGNEVLVGVRLNNNDREEDTKRNIQQAVQNHLDGKTIHLLTNDSQFNRLKTIDQDLRNVGPKDDPNLYINSLIRMNNNNR